MKQKGTEEESKTESLVAESGKKVKRRADKDNQNEADLKKPKFSIVLNENKNGEDTVKTFKKSKKGPKILIAQEPTAPQEIKQKKEKKKKRKNNKETSLEIDAEHKDASIKSEAEKTVHESKGMNKALRYLKTWTNDRQNWKFEKCRQIWLIQNSYNDQKVPEKDFPSLLKYMESIRGRMRQLTLENAKKKMEKGERWQEMITAGKNEDEVTTALGEKIPDVEFARATKIVEMLIE